MARLTRRRFALLAAGGALGLAAGVRLALPRLIRARPVRPLGDEARAFVEERLADLHRARVVDCHVHLIGVGTNGSGCHVDPASLEHRHALRRLQHDLLREASGMRTANGADEEYVARLIDLHEASGPTGRRLILAFDWHVDAEGFERPERSPLYTPNAYASAVAERHPDFRFAASVHPYRHDALERLDAAIAAGARALKWLPNSMGIDPASPRCDRIYARLAELRLPLLCHGGKEYAVESGADQELGNPLRLRRALEAGVVVILAHCASLGRFADLDAPERSRGEVESFELFLRLLGERRHDGRLYGDISSLMQVHHPLRPLRALLARPDLQRRLVYGSDYPLPALRWLASTRRLQAAGLLTPRERRLCNEVFAANPLLFDLVLARSLHVSDGGKPLGFAGEVFETAQLFG